MKAFVTLAAFAFALATACAGAGIEAASHAADRGVADLRRMTGRELVQQLLPVQSRLAAFHELVRRADRKEATDLASFAENHEDPEVVVCPQATNAPPIYLLLYGFLGTRFSPPGDAYEVANPLELFPPEDVGLPLRWEEPGIDAFTSEGRRIVPFGGNTMLQRDGRICDLNGDGLIERADESSFCVDGVEEVSVFEAAVVRETAQPLLAVLYNWGRCEWVYRITDEDRDGVCEFRFGPWTKSGFKPKVTFRWDKASGKYVGPSGAEGDHFRVLSGNDLWSECKRLKRARLTFPADPDAADETTVRTQGVSREDETPPSPRDTSKPYRAGSLRQLTNEEIVRYMGRGKNNYDLECAGRIETRAAANFWDGSPRAVALATADTNRTPSHRSIYRLAIDDRDGERPPDICSLAFTYHSAACYDAVQGDFFLRVEPGNSYLAYAASSEPGVVFHDFVRSRPVFDFRCIELSTGEARHVAQVIWWLNRVRSSAPRSQFGSFWESSTADGLGEIELRNAGGTPVIHVEKTIWFADVADRWHAEYAPETFVNLASFILSAELPSRLGNRWSQFDPSTTFAPFEQGAKPAYTAEELARMRALAKRFLDLYSTNQTRISAAIAIKAARTAGGLGFTELDARLAEIATMLPASATNSAKELRETISIARRKIAAFDDVKQLKSWACTEEDGQPWALQRLGELDRSAYVSVLEWWLKHAGAPWARQVCDELTKVDPARAAEIAKRIPAGRKDALAVSAFAHLAAVDGVPDEDKRVKTLIAIALDPKSGWEERCKAIELLVPLDKPLRYPSRDVDRALVRLLDPKVGDDTINFTRQHAGRALARRGNTKSFDAIASILEQRKDDSSDPSVAGETTGALAHLAQSDPKALNPRLAALLSPHFKNTNLMMTEILQAVWAADLRGLRNELERLATSGADDVEDGKANSCGGDVTPVEGRFHLARKIVAIWNEPDPHTRAKLLLAFGANELPDEECPERAARLRLELQALRTALSADELAAALSFLDWLCAREPGADDATNPERLRSYRRFAAAALTL